MTARSTRELEAAVAARLAAVPGVRGTFGAREAVIGPHPTADAVDLDAAGPTLRITVRLATDRAIPAHTVIAGAVAALDDLLGSRPYALDLEIAVID